MVNPLEDIKIIRVRQELWTYNLHKMKCNVFCIFMFNYI